AARHVVPVLPGLCTRAGAPDVPLQRSVVQTLPSSVHAVPDAFTVSPGQVALLPGDVSWRSHSLAAARQTNVESWNASLGHVLLLPVHVSATSQPPDAAARHVVPALPGLWTQSGLPTVPLQRSVVQTLPSSLHAVPDALTVSPGQVALLPGHVSWMSHSFAAARQTNVDNWKASLGHVLLLPVHVSATSQPPDAAARHVVPALPGLWTQCGLPTVPLQRSVAHSSSSSLFRAPDALTVSPGQVALLPGHVSWRSHSLAAARQTNVEGWNASLGHVLLLPVHVSATSQPPPAAARHVVPALPGLWTQSGLPTVPLQRSVVQTLPSSLHAVPDAFTVSFGQVELEPVQSSALSHSLAAARHVAPELPGACTHAGAPEVPLQRSVVQALPSLVHAVPDAFTVSPGQVALLPGQVSCVSHSF